MSTKTIAQKLLIKPNTTIWSSHPANLDLIQPLPVGIDVVDGLGQATTALVFAYDASGLRELLSTHQNELSQPSILWVAYPKGNRIDLNRDSLWPILGEYGMRPITQVAVDEVWSALRFARTKKARRTSPVVGSKAWTFDLIDCRFQVLANDYLTSRP